MSKLTASRRTALLGLAALAALTGCGSGFDASLPLADGTYRASSEPDEEGAVGNITVVISGGVITGAEFVIVQRDGTLKDEDYGKGSDGQPIDDDYYKQAQLAVQACETYSRQLLEVRDPGDVDVVSGATWAHDQFVAAAEDALRQAQTAVTATASGR
ncbi:MAG: FMN-binding protein [Propionibacteriaceae bacterium]|nr:FMN-binding protein [Propionibacteriaceae bacterium]